MNKTVNPIVKVFRFYVDGFKSMKLGKTLWAIILVKLFIMFAILKFIFFPNFLNSRYDTSKEKSEYVLHELTDRNQKQ